MPTTDRRAQKTRQALTDALLRLLKDTAWEDISIQQLCAEANCGRTTFYAHHPHKDSLLVAAMHTWRDSMLSQAAAPETRREPFAYLTPLVNHMAEQRAVFRSVMGRRGSGPVEREFRALVLQLLQATPPCAPHAPPAPDWDLTARFIAGGWVDLMKWWVETPSPVPSQALMARMRQLAHNAMQPPAPG